MPRHSIAHPERSRRAARPDLIAALLTLSLTFAVACGDEGAPADPGAEPEPTPDTVMDIRGQISGLDGGAVAVTNRGGEAAVLAANGAFTLIDQGEGAYDVQVVTNPRDQQCTVTGGRGFEDETDVDGVQIVCADVDAAGCVGAVDSDGDDLSDCAELGTWGTNPWIADTDGDGFEDGREVRDFNPGSDNFLFNPRIADLASIAIDVESLPDVTLDFKQSNDETVTVDIERSSSSTSSIQRDRGGSQTRQLETGHTVSASVSQTIGAEVSVSPTDLGGSASYEVSLSTGVEASTTQSRGSSINWSESEARENSQAWAESVAQSQTAGTSYEGGQLSVLVTIRNDGNLAYDLENLKLSAYLFDPARPFAKRPVGTLELGSRDFPTTSIGVKSTSAPLVFTTDLLLPTAQSLLRDARNLVIEPATYRLLDISNGSILLRDQDVAARTATVTIDYGELAGRVDSHRVAVNRGGAVKFITAAQALGDVMGLDYEEGTGEWIYADADDAGPSFAGLTRVRGYAMDADESRYWLVAHSYKTEGGAGAPATDVHNLLLGGYDLDQIVLQAGDHLTLVYVGDADRDALADRLELEIGTDPEDADTDDDTIEDGTELYGWYTNLASPPCDEGELTLVKSNPLLADTDDDSIDDGSERAACDNPGFDFAAIAGDDQWVSLEAPVQLSGSFSGTGVEAPEYRWTLLRGPDIEGPRGPTRELLGASPTFVAPDTVSSLVFELEVTSDGVSQTDEVVVQVLEDAARALFVGTPHPSGAADGSPERPYTTLAEALLIAFFQDDGEDVYVMTRDTPYVVPATVNPPPGTSLYGGYDADWVRDAAANRTPVQLSTISSLDVQPVLLLDDVEGEVTISGFVWTTQRGHSTAERDVYGVVIQDTTPSQGRVRLLDNTIVAGDVYGVQTDDPADSYGLFVDGLYSLELAGNTITSGRGGTGRAGDKGATGQSGNPGGNGTTGGDGGAGARGKEGLNGGKGGAAGTGFNESGGNGGYGEAHNGSCGRRGNAGTKDGGATSGWSGCIGRSGVHGAGGRGIGEADRATGYTPTRGATGGKGGPGGGGGGGGGGAANNVGKDGGAGGGGGEGGGGGLGGTGGVGGGASIAVWLANVELTFVRDNDILAGAGGIGGRGGEAGDGGPFGGGGSGAPGDESALGRGGAGGNGGNGGLGGAGGWGGGGGGGASIGVFFASGKAPLILGNRISTTGGGAGGYAPLTTGAGYGGDSFGVFDAIVDAEIPSVTANVFSVGPGGAAGLGSDNVGRSGEQN